MRAVTLYAVVDVDKCKGCTRCERVCPVLAIKVENKKAVVDPENCLGCANCEQRCPEMAITMVPLEQSRVVQESLAGVDMAAVIDLCRRAHLHPKQIICYCTATRAEEVAAAVLKGAKSPEEISRRTGVRTGCKVECIQPVLRLLHAAGIAPERPARGYQWYGLTPTVWDIPEEVKKKYAQRGFYFDEDRKLLDSLVGACEKGGGIMLRAPVMPLPPRRSQYGVAPELVRKRAAELPDMVSVLVRDLFPDAAPVIYPGENGLEMIREATRKQMEKVDLSMIKPGDSVNVLGSHHGFTLLGGAPYAEMLRTIRDVVRERTGCTDIRLRVGVGLRFRESEEYIKAFGLDEYYEGKAAGVAPVDEGVAIETEIGTLYGIKKIYDARWIIHAHNSDVREVHFHRQVDRAVKPFGMSYARIETRSTYHQNLGPRAANFVARAIFDSPFVQEKFACAVFLMMSPSGVVGVDADNDLYALNDRVTYLGCRDYGKMMTLLGEIDEAITILDFPSPVPYVFAAGVIFANFAGANRDLFDLDDPLPPYTWYTEAFYGEDGRPLIEGVPPVNPAIKVVIHNYAWGGYPSAFFTEHIPTIVVGREQAELLNRDPQNLSYTRHTLLAEDLDTAVRFAKRVAGTDKILAFDGASGALNVSRSLGEYLLQKAPLVSRRVDGELLPKWLKQRGIDPSRFKIC